MAESAGALKGAGSVTSEYMRAGGEAGAFFGRQFAIDEAILSELLGIALARGGDYAELYFEHRESGNILFEEQRVKNVGGGIVQGLGVRVISGDAIGYAYTEDLSHEPMRKAADTAARISDRRDRVGPVAVRSQTTTQFYPVLGPAVDAPAAEKLELIRRADQAGRAYHPSIIRVDIAFVDEFKRILIASSDGRLAGDVQPMVRFNVTCLSEIDGSRQSATSGGGGRFGMEYFSEQTPERIAIDAARQAVLLQSAQEAPAGSMPVVLGAGDAGVLLHEAVGHGLEADFNRKKTSNYSDRVGEPVASPLCTIVDDGTISTAAGQSMSTMKAMAASSIR